MAAKFDTSFLFRDDDADRARVLISASTPPSLPRGRFDTSFLFRDDDDDIPSASRPPQRAFPASEDATPVQDEQPTPPDVNFDLSSYVLDMDAHRRVSGNPDFARTMSVDGRVRPLNDPVPYGESPVPKPGANIFDRIQGTIHRGAAVGADAVRRVVPEFDKSYEPALTKDQLARGRQVAERVGGDFDLKELSSLQPREFMEKLDGVLTGSEQVDLHKYLSNARSRERLPDFTEFARTQRGAAEIVDPLSGRLDRMSERLDKTEDAGKGFLDRTGKAWTLGDVGMSVDIALTNAVMSGDKDAQDRALALKARVEQLRSQNKIPQGAVEGVFNDVVGILPGMARGFAPSLMGAVPFAGAVLGPIGKAIGVSQWGMQGAGSILAAAHEAGADMEKALPIALAGGAAYAAVEKLQVGNIIKLSKPAQEAVKRRILNSVKRFALKWGWNTAENTAQEVAQQLIEDATADIIAHTQDVEHTPEYLKNAVETAVQSFFTMGALSGASATVGAVRSSVRGATNLVQERHGDKVIQDYATDKELIGAALQGRTIRDVEHNTEFTVDDDATYSEARSRFRGWRRKNNGTLEVVGAQKGDFEVDVEEYGDAQETQLPQDAHETPVYQRETQEEGEAGEVSGQEENAQEGAENEVSEGGAKTHEDADIEQVQREYEAAVDPDLVSFIEEVRSAQGNAANGMELRVSKIGDKQKRDTEALLGRTLNATSNFINGSRVLHIEDRHGANGKADNSMANIEDVARIGYTLENFDRVDFVRDNAGAIKRNGSFTASDGKAAPMIMYVKRINGFYSVVEAVTDGKRQRLEIASAYKSASNPLDHQDSMLKETQMPRATTDNRQSPGHTSETVSASTSTPNIPQSPPKINSGDKKIFAAPLAPPKPADQAAKNFPSFDAYHRWQDAISRLRHGLGLGDIPQRALPAPQDADVSTGAQPAQKKRRGRSKATPKKTADTQTRGTLENIPEENHTPEFRKARLSRKIADGVYEALKRSGHDGWLVDWQIITGAGNQVAQRGGGWDGATNTITEKTQNILNSIAERYNMDSDARYQSHQLDNDADGVLGDNEFARAGFAVPKHGDDVRTIVESAKSKAAYKKYAADYNRDYWERRAAETERDGSASDEAWRVLSEAPESLTQEQRELIEEDLRGDLEAYLEDMDAPQDVIDMVRGNTTYRSSSADGKRGGGGGAGADYSMGRYAADVSSGTDYYRSGGKRATDEPGRTAQSAKEHAPAAVDTGYKESKIEAETRRALENSAGQPIPPGAVKVIPSYSVKGLNKRIVGVIERVTGKNIVAVEINHDMMTDALGHSFDGFFVTDGTLSDNIYVISNPLDSQGEGDMKRPILMTIGHEFYHVLERTPELKRVVEAIYDKIHPQRTGKGIGHEQNAKRDADGNMEKGRSEFTADVVGRMLNDVAFWEELSRRKDTTFQRVVDAVLEILDRVIDALNNVIGNVEADAYIKNVKSVQRQLRKAVTAYKGRLDRGEIGKVAGALGNVEVAGGEVRLAARQGAVSSVKDIDAQFNHDLQRQINGTLPKGYVYRFGRASGILQSAGIPALDIEMYAERLKAKSEQKEHPFDLADMRHLPTAIQEPLAVFDSATQEGSFVILTTLRQGNKNYVVAIEANRQQGNLLINSIRSVHPRDSRQVVGWINKGLMKYADKKEMANWISRHQFNSGDAGNPFSQALNIVKGFTNPKLPSDNNNIRQETEKSNSEVEKSEKSFYDPRPIDEKAFKRLLRTLRKTGLAQDVVADADEMRDYLAEHYGKRNADRFMSLWHGSPHSFDKFSTDFMGTGEGNQSYGWGLYFTDLESIARSYARVKGTPLDVFKEMNRELRHKSFAGVIYHQIDNYYIANDDGLLETLYSDIRNEKIEIGRGIGSTDRRDQLNAAIEYVENNSLKYPQGEMYRVKIHGDKTADELNFIRWDKWLTEEQSDALLKYARTENVLIGIAKVGGRERVNGTGEMIYAGLRSNFKNDAEVSKFLLRAGIDGIQYPTGYLSKGSHENAYNYVVFDDSVIDIVEKIKLMATPTGEVYGFTTPDGKIYLDPNKMNANTPIHEFGHLWVDYVKKSNPALYTRLRRFVKKSDILNDLRDNPAYSDLDAERLEEEAIAYAIGNNGEAMFADGNPTLVERLQRALADLWEWIGEHVFGNLHGTHRLPSKEIRVMTFAELVEGAARDLVSGREIVDDRQVDGGGNAAGVKRAKFDAAPMARITGDEIFDWVEPLDMKTIRAKAVSWMRENGHFRDDYVNEDTGMGNIIVNANTIRNSMQHGAGPEKVQVVAALPEMIRDGIHVRAQPGKDHQHNMTEHVFVAKVEVDGAEKLVGFIVKEDATGKRFYDHELTEIRNLDEVPSQVGEAQSTDRVTVRPRRDSIIKIIQNELGVNRESKNNSDDPRFAFVGRKGAKNLDRNKPLSDGGASHAGSLKAAKDMAAAGEDARAIKAATNWERGADGKWRYEIPDGDFLFDSRADIPDGVNTLDKLIADDADLFAAYPGLRDIAVKFEKDMPRNAGATWDAENTTIRIADDMTAGAAIRHALVHEIQHAIQDIEGFARGGNSSMFDTSDGRRESAHEQYRRLAGETEARNVSARMDMSREERRSKTAEDTEDVLRDEQDVRFARRGSNIDTRYFEALESGDTETAQRIVDAQAKKNGYVSGNDYRLQHQAPNRNDYRLSELLESGIVPDDYWTHPQYYQNDAQEHFALNAVKSALNRYKENGKCFIWVYRSVPKNVKEDKIRNGDWVTPLKSYAISEGQEISGGYRVIAQRANIENLWWDANSILEFGYDDGKNYAYRNTRNNRKLVDTITRDEYGKIIPPSKRFSYRNPDIRFAKRGNYIRGSDVEQASNRDGGRMRNDEDVSKEFMRGLEPYSTHEINNLKNNPKHTIADYDASVRSFVEGSLADKRQGEKLLLGKIGGELGQRILDATGVDLKGYNLEFRANEIKHTYNEHGDPLVESRRGQIAITAEDIIAFPEVVNNFDDIIVAHDNSLHFIKDIGGKITAVTVYANRSKSLSLKTMYKHTNKGGGSGPAVNVPKNPAKNTQGDRTTAPITNNIGDSETKSKGESENSENNFATPSKRAKNAGVRLASRAAPPPADASDAPSGDASDRDNAAAAAVISSGLRPVALPELVELAKAVLPEGVIPEIRKKIKSGKAKGVTIRNKATGEVLKIALAADLAKEDDRQLEKVLAHEIGHALSKWGGTGKYKALATKIKNAIHLLREYIGDDPDAEKENLTAKDRARIRREVTKLLKKGGKAWIDEVITSETPYTPEDIMAVWNSVNQDNIDTNLSDYIKGFDTAQKKAIILEAIRNKSVPDSVPKKTEEIATGRRKLNPAAVARAYREAIIEEARKHRLTEIKTIYDELYALSKKWRPLPENPTAEELAYRQKGEEVFADAISVLLNDPDLLFRRAPNFWRVFTGWEGARNPFSEVYSEIQKLYKQGEAAVFEKRDRRMGEMFDKGRQRNRDDIKKKRDEARKWGGLSQLWREAVKWFIDMDDDMRRLVENVMDRGGKIDDGANPYLNRRKRRYLDSYKTAYEQDIKNAMGVILGDLNDEAIRALDKYMYLNRVINERSDMPNPQGYTSATARESLDALKDAWGDERFFAVKRAAEKFAELRKEYIISEIEQSGMFDDNFVKYVKNNDHYATFDVLQKIAEDHGKKEVMSMGGSATPTGIRRQTGTFRDIAPVFIATLENDMKLLSYIDRNNITKSAINLLLEHKNDLGYEAIAVPKEYQGEGRGLRYVDNTYHGRNVGKLDGHEGTFRIVTFRENGKQVAYYVSTDIANLLIDDYKKAPAALRVLRFMAGFFRNIFTQKNPAFWAWNVQRDFRSFHRNIPQGSIIEKMAAWKAARKEVAKYLKTGVMTDDIRNALKERAILSKSAYSRDGFHSRWDAELEAQLEGMSSDAQGKYRERALKRIGNKLDGINDMLELSTKIAGYKILKQDASVSAEQRAQLIRTRVGTPDVHAGGTLTPWSNVLFLFSNMQIQGLRESWNVMKENPKRSLAMWAIHDAIPMLPAVLAQHGLLAAIGRAIGESGNEDDDDGGGVFHWFERAYNKIPTWDKVFRTAIPIPVQTETGKQIYAILPHSEMGQTQRAITYHLLDGALSAFNKDNDLLKLGGEKFTTISGELLSDIIPFSLGSLLPPLQVAGAGVTLIGGGDPIDFHKYGQGRPDKIIRRKNRGEPLKEMKDIGIHSLNKMGASVVWTVRDDMFDFENYLEDKHWLEALLGLPVVGNPAGRFFRVSDMGLTEREDVERKRLTKK